MLQKTPVSHSASAAVVLPVKDSPQGRRVLSETELAHRWGVSPKTLQRWRTEGRGPKYLKLSKRVTYPLDAIAQFEHDALHVSTSERVAK